ncbi:unnamed protein product [Rotaria socialis]|uniref:TIR domain-containing protein n=1 Tax=Rotaria socialis TaxID=392032 RepID=A0A820RYY6_9BILA|nr:unnamed protein product [Rotaria socialis]CAF4444662.1 unnamed protein product [Rotaria socialis]
MMETQTSSENIIKRPFHLQEHEELTMVEQVKQSFDSITRKIDEDKNLILDRQIIKEIVDLAIQSNEKHLCDSSIIDHRAFFILRDYFLNLLQRWRFGEVFDDTSYFIFESISSLFLKMSSHISNGNLSTLKELIFHETFLNEMNRFFDELSVNGKYLEDHQIKSMDNLLRTIQRLERINFDTKKDYLFDNIVKCICSSSFIEIFLQSVNQDNEDVGHRFLLNTCTDYIYSHSTDQKHKQSLIDIRQTLLRPFTQWLIQQSSLFRFWNNRMLITLRQICFLLTLSIQLNRLILLDKDILDDYYQIIDSFVNILYSIIQSENKTNNKLSQSLIGTIIPNIYTMTLSKQLEKYIQNKHIISLILKLTDFENDEIQLNAFKILSSITTEQETKNIVYSNTIASLFIKFLNKVIDDSNQTLRFYNLLRSLKSLIQYDQITDELTKQNGLPLIMRCATDSKFKPIQVQQPALEILFILTFNNEAYQRLKSYSTEIKPFLSSSHQRISQVADMILWKLEKEEQALTKPNIQDRNYKYDIILSYSQSDKDLCLRIYDELMSDDFRVWIDQDENFTMTMNEKCEIIDECEYFIMCASETYKQNAFCRSEASFAFERQLKIIPIIVLSNYRPDGWLNRIINGKIPIDFTKLGFELAKSKLKNDIDRQRKFTKMKQIKDSISIDIPVDSSQDNDIPSRIDQWTKNHVKLFLIGKNLNPLLEIFSEMNGNLLHELYLMCLSNRESMFHTLKTEISTLYSNNQPLTLIIYLRFLNEIQKYIPTFAINQK